MSGEDDDSYLEFCLFEMLNGGRDDPLRVGRLPDPVRRAMGWLAAQVYLTPATAQKIRFKGARIRMVDLMRLGDTLRFGDFYTDEPDSLIVVLPSRYKTPRRDKIFYLVLRQDRNGGGIFIRTFFIKALTNRKMRKLRPIFLRSRWHRTGNIKKAA